MKIQYPALMLLALLAVGCGTHKRTYNEKPRQPEKKQVEVEKAETETLESTSKTTVYTDVVRAYIGTYDDIAMAQMKTYGIPASITLAQGILESGAGRGDLVKRANNHFGIKCHKGWTGPSVSHDDDSRGECFRKYRHPEESYADHSRFLTGRQRYAFLFEYEKDDYKAWAKGLKKAGYATDPRYPNKLISIIEKYGLYTFDAMVLGKKVNQPAVAFEGEDLNAYKVQKGDTLYSLSRKYGVSVDKIKELNGLKDNNIQIGQELYFK
ncbi:LysM peptidoglycan-binding domain-containing protein [Robertkochia marina]|uniref:Peptidoglycan hydrolase n=1 Tax=Robertkochia marina TaxID=1227945 RepID=A0A4S3M1A7_9FLAO|nr:glucosaminidase domain-containing protein [Robertkochia marina]THD68763.1 LysM peptidoglycan-binding domain-containing protein [Robertkochia marina]TRZ43834.1 LysM peptidoglycan-binding domain-containing protein [Robertkochia marina]